MKLLLDTWGWITLSNKREPRHEEVKIFYEEFRHKKGVLYTTDYILDEAVTLLLKFLHSANTQNTTEIILNSRFYAQTFISELPP